MTDTFTKGSWNEYNLMKEINDILGYKNSQDEINNQIVNKMNQLVNRINFQDAYLKETSGYLEEMRDLVNDLRERVYYGVGGK